ncbi:MAG: UDP-N-acetylmuramoyl-L-alanyl-D-glutamate--2,6-diaminopimelate ligase [Mailhella sp.]|nr:UDP-N-acetylmuramoyl-L-alanyl-D-glutamate--2,6-diaminopimelate ligase [Mailhella sp.]
MLLTKEQICAELKTGKRRLETDSRLVEQGDVFAALPPAIPGEEDRSLQYAQMALDKKAWCIAASSALAGSFDGKTLDRSDTAFVFCDDMRAFLGDLAAAAYGTSDIDVPVIGITGTNGKTTCTYLLEHLYQSKGVPVGVLGTISYRWPGHEEAAPLTTPGCLVLHRSIAAMRKSGAKAVIMEASSHAISQKRIAGIPFAAAAFTNLTQDHLDYHKTFEAYFQAKRALFSDFPLHDKKMVINADDAYGCRLLEENPSALAFGLSRSFDDRPSLKADVVKSDTSGLKLLFRWHMDTGAERSWELSSPLVGLHNASNLLLVSGLALSLGFSPEDLTCFSSFMGVPGRLERIPSDINPNFPGCGAGVFVDYAHTPDALTRVLLALKAAKFKRIITVFGCGGDRDRTKRPLMGKAVAELSDVAVVTSDNPRTEDPERIIDDIIPGLSEAARLYREADRRKALELAVSILQPGDALLVAGKGHENYQIIGKQKHHFSDQEILRELLS